MQKRKKIFLICIAFLLLLLIGFNIEYTYTKIRSAFIHQTVEEQPGNAPPNTYPVLLLHGFNGLHSKRVGEYAFHPLQERLEEDLDYRDAGIYTSTRACAELAYTDKPITIRASYFLPDTTSIGAYAAKLQEMIDRILYCTGAEQVDIITHSMGGIVSRYYLQQHGTDNVHKLIMIATPNHGGLYQAAELNNLLIEDGEGILNIDFISLSEDNTFMQTLNAQEAIPDVLVYTIAGDIDGIGDGVVRKESVALAGTQGHAILPCGHVFIKNTHFCEELYPFVKTMLTE